MPGEIGQARDAERRRLRRNHRERVAVCEAERHADRRARRPPASRLSSASGGTCFMPSSSKAMVPVYSG